MIHYRDAVSLCLLGLSLLVRACYPVPQGLARSDVRAPAGRPSILIADGARVQAILFEPDSARRICHVPGQL